MSDFNSVITTVDHSGTTALLQNAGERLSVENDQLKSEGSFVGRVLRTVANIFSLGIYGLVKDAQVKSTFTQALKNSAETAEDPKVKALINRAVHKLENSNVVGVTGNVANHFKEVIGRDDWDGLRKAATADAFRAQFTEDVAEVKAQVREELGSAQSSPNITLESNKHGQFVLGQLAGLSERVESVLSNPHSSLADIDRAFETWEAKYNQAYESVDGLHDAAARLPVRLANKVKTELQAFVQGHASRVDNEIASSPTGIKVTLTTKK